MEEFIKAIYPYAASLTNPLALAGTTILLFFGIAKISISALGPALANATGRDATATLRQIITYGFILALVALLGALFSWGIEQVYKRYYEQTALIREGDQAARNRDPLSLSKIGTELVSRWPNEPYGYSFLGQAHFLNQDYACAARTFDSGLVHFSTDLSACERKHVNMQISFAAALGADQRVEEALSAMSAVTNCPIPKGASFNLAKLLVLNGNEEEGLEYIKDSSLVDSSVPDYRDRTYLLEAVALIRLSSPPESVIEKLLASYCVNTSFSGIILNVSSDQTGAPSGDKNQTYAFERGIVKAFLDDNNLRPQLGDLFSNLNNCPQEEI